MRHLAVRNDHNESANGASQALALYVKADRARFRNVRLIGNQDTLLAHGAVRAYFYKSYVEGDVDFISGSGTSVFDNCEIFSSTRNQSNNGYVTATATASARTYGILIVNTRLTSEAAVANYTAQKYLAGSDGWNPVITG